MMNLWEYCRMAVSVNSGILFLSQRSSSIDMADVMTSKSSTLPYDNDTMQKMLALVRNAKGTQSQLK